MKKRANDASSCLSRTIKRCAPSNRKALNAPCGNRRGVGVRRPVATTADRLEAALVNDRGPFFALARGKLLAGIRGVLSLSKATKGNPREPRVRVKPIVVSAARRATETRAFFAQLRER